MAGFGGRPFVEERIHVRGEILDDRQVAQGADCEATAARNFGDMGAAGPAGGAVYRHGARAAHADAAGKAVGQRWVGVLLDPGDDVEDGLVFLGWDRERLAVPLGGGSPVECHDQAVCHHAPPCVVDYTADRREGKARSAAVGALQFEVALVRKLRSG